MHGSFPIAIAAVLLLAGCGRAPSPVAASSAAEAPRLQPARVASPLAEPAPSVVVQAAGVQAPIDPRVTVGPASAVRVGGGGGIGGVARAAGAGGTGEARVIRVEAESGSGEDGASGDQDD